jgi:protein-tyrosine sulfotransferase
MPDDPSQSPVFVLTASRSGSTLLRFILDSHPELACPPETHVGGVCGELANLWSVLERARTDGTSLPPDQAQVIAALRAAIDGAFGHYLCGSGKRRWCDKSPNTFRHIRLLTQMYPDAKFICLYRHCMDMIASGIEACPWGLQNFGFEPFAARYPGNNVAAIGSYWLDTVQGIMAV